MTTSSLVISLIDPSCIEPEVGGSQDNNFFFAGIDKVRFRKPVIAGDTLVMRMTLVKFQKRFGLAKMEGKAYVGLRGRVHDGFCWQFLISHLLYMFVSSYASFYPFCDSLFMSSLLNESSDTLK
ncbi:hypothetical protein Bca4012_096265 [Brassica carinata]